MEIRKGVGAWWRLEREWGHEEIRKGVGHGGD